MSGSSVIAASLGLSGDGGTERDCVEPGSEASNEIAADLRVEPKVIEMFLGESQQLGSDIRIMRGDLEREPAGHRRAGKPRRGAVRPGLADPAGDRCGRDAARHHDGDKIVRVSVNVKLHGTELGSTLDVQPSSVDSGRRAGRPPGRHDRDAQRREGEQHGHLQGGRSDRGGRRRGDRAGRALSPARPASRSSFWGSSRSLCPWK